MPALSGLTVADLTLNLPGPFASLQRMIEAAQARGDARADADPQFATWTVYGALEEILGGWVLGQLPGKEGDVERAVASVVEVFSIGLAA